MNKTRAGHKFHLHGISNTVCILLLASLCIILNSCAPVPTQESLVTTEPVIEPQSEEIVEQPPTTTPVIVPAVEEEPSEAVVFIQETAWDFLQKAKDNPFERDEFLIEAANILISENRVEEAQDLMSILQLDQLSAVDQVNYKILEVRILQAAAQHRTAIRRLDRLERIENLNPELLQRVVQFKIYSYSQLRMPIDVVREQIRLISILPSGSLQSDVGHSLWSHLRQLSLEELAQELAKTNDPKEKQWFLLALGTNAIQHDPYQFNTVVLRWLADNLDHPARMLVEKGLLIPSWEDSQISKIAVLLPLSSPQYQAAQVFLDGFKAQYSADTSPDKPLVEVIDIGSDPSNVTQFYYNALDRGADVIIGPLGTKYAREMANIGEFWVPTLLLGDAGDISLPDSVFQFTLAPEEDAIAVARRARLDGHVTALTLATDTNWSNRELKAFTDEFHRLGGSVIQNEKYKSDDQNFSEILEKLLNIEASKARYSELREVVPQRFSFIPRRRNDVDFIFLSADSDRGRLIKPHLDFLKSHDLPVYATSRIFDGEFNELNDQDLNGIRFTDLNWVIDRNSNMLNLRQKLGKETKHPIQYERLFAFGIDAYNLSNYFQVMTLFPDTRHHGVVAMLGKDRNGKIERIPLWAQFVNGEPELLTEQPNPEIIYKSIDYILPSIVEQPPEHQ